MEIILAIDFIKEKNIIYLSELQLETSEYIWTPFYITEILTSEENKFGEHIIVKGVYEDDDGNTQTRIIYDKDFYDDTEEQLSQNNWKFDEEKTTMIRNLLTVQDEVRVCRDLIRINSEDYDKRIDGLEKNIFIRKPSCSFSLFKTIMMMGFNFLTTLCILRILGF